MFETLDSIRGEKFVSSLSTRIFFLTYGVGGALGASIDFYRHGLHRPVTLSIETLMFVVRGVVAGFVDGAFGGAT